MEVHLRRLRTIQKGNLPGISRLVMSSRKPRFVSDNDSNGKVTHSIYVTNFPSEFKARQLWDICSQYGKVVDTFIPSRLLKEGKRFAFVRYGKEVNLPLLIDNLNTIWVGKFQLRFNIAKYQRGDKPFGLGNRGQKAFTPKEIPLATHWNRSYASVVKKSTIPNQAGECGTNKPVMVIVDKCLIDKNMELTLVVNVKDFESLPNLRVLCNNEGVAYWFAVIKDWYAEFKVDERVAWVDIEGLPSVAWTQKRNVYGLRARKITGWNPEFIEDASESDTDVESEGRNVSDDPFGIYDLLNQKVAEKEIEQVVSDDPSHLPGFTKDVELKQKVGEVDSCVDKEGGFDETFKPVSQLGVSRSNDGKQSVDKS
ncbi:nucleotide-binding alpha-beta plait domain-containing protein [Tanacetum coccineum]|uniref:Nucleotide-binding alpha-beta plait domain-containing protein n=1 Tax=Tanacetum coccineum TaxID=301880 RepID=A0ABQ5GFJ5_9ASTR